MPSEASKLVILVDDCSTLAAHVGSDLGLTLDNPLDTSYHLERPSLRSWMYFFQGRGALRFPTEKHFQVPVRRQGVGTLRGRRIIQEK